MTSASTQPPPIVPMAWPSGRMSILVPTSRGARPLAGNNGCQNGCGVCGVFTAKLAHDFAGIAARAPDCIFHLNDFCHNGDGNLLRCLSADIQTDGCVNAAHDFGVAAAFDNGFFDKADAAAAAIMPI